MTAKALAQAGLPHSVATKNPAPALVTNEKPPMAGLNETAQTPASANADFLAGTFLRSFHSLLSATRLYQRNHPVIAKNLELAEHTLRAAFLQLTRIDVQIEPAGLSLSTGSLADENRLLADPRGELQSLAAQMSEAGVSTLCFLPKANISELELLARAVFATSHAATRQSAGGRAGRRDWSAWLADRQISGIRVNAPNGQREEDTALSTLISALTAAEPAEAPTRFPECTFENLQDALSFLSSAGPRLEQARPQPAMETAEIVHTELASASPHSINLIKYAIAVEPPRPGDTSRSYFSRLCRTLVVDFTLAEYQAGKIQPPEVRPLLTQFGRYGAALNEEAENEARAELFWSTLPAREKARVLATENAWCVPVPVLRHYLEPLIAATRSKGAEASGREARRALADFARCVRSEETKARRATAAGLVELADFVDRLWPHPRFAEFAGHVVDALLVEASPGIAGLLAAATEMLARLALQQGDYAAFEQILDGLSRAPNDDNHEAISALSLRIIAQDRWLLLVDTALANRPLDPALPRLLRRDPERLVDRLGLLLTTPEGADSFQAMARLVRAAGEPVLGALQSHLSQPRQQRIATAIKLLSAVNPERLATALPHAFPGWDWGLQDLAITALARQSQDPLCSRIAKTFLQLLPEAHFYVMPAMLDRIAFANEVSAVPLLIEIAEGKVDLMRDLFVRIKAVETIGHLRAESAAPMLRELVRARSGVTYLEPAGLRSAAEEALALIENRPSSIRLRAAKEAIAQSSAHFERPRRYQRFRLPSPLAARIEGLHPASAEVHVLALGGALIETEQPLAPGETFRIEMRAGLRRIIATSVIRSCKAQGYGIEFVHMKQEDRERLRRYLASLR